MTEDATPTRDIVASYEPFVAPESLERLVRACEQIEDFRALARRSSAARFMVDAIESVAPSTTDLDEWIVRVTAHYLDSLVDQSSSGLLRIVAHEDFLLGECHGYNTKYIAEECPRRRRGSGGSDGSD